MKAGSGEERCRGGGMEWKWAGIKDELWSHSLFNYQILHLHTLANLLPFFLPQNIYRVLEKNNCPILRLRIFPTLNVMTFITKHLVNPHRFFRIL